MPATPTISVADQADGTGATLTITGSDAGSSNEAFVTQWTGNSGSVGSWASEGTRVGDGTIDLTIADGYWWVYVTSTAGGDVAASVPNFFRSSTAADAIFYDCLEGVQSRIRALNLTGVLTDDIMVQKTWIPPEDRLRSNEPVITIAPVPETVEHGVTNEQDDAGYGVLVSIFQVSNRQETKHNSFLKWREQISRALRFQRLTGVDSIHQIRIEPGPVIDPARFFDGNMDVGGLVARCLSRETRGLT